MGINQEISEIPSNPTILQTDFFAGTRGPCHANPLEVHQQRISFLSTILPYIFSSHDNVTLQLCYSKKEAFCQ